VFTIVIKSLPRLIAKSFIDPPDRIFGTSGHEARSDSVTSTRLNQSVHRREKARMAELRPNPMETVRS
jgi:hypothetical protein